MGFDFEGMKALYAKQLRENADVLETCKDIDTMICALYSFSALSIGRFSKAKRHVVDRAKVVEFCNRIDNWKPSQK